MYDARALTASMGLTEPRRSNHSAEVLKTLDEFPCETCGRMVGGGARSSSQCLGCLRDEFHAIGLPLEEFDRLFADWSAQRTQ